MARTQTIMIMPGPGGAHNWAPMSFNPNTGLMYIPSSASSSSQYAVTRRTSSTPRQRQQYGPARGGNRGGNARATYSERDSGSGRGDWRRTGAASTADRASGPRAARDRAAIHGRVSGGLGRREAKGKVARAGWRQHRRRHRDDGGQPCVPVPGQRTPSRLDVPTRANS